LPSRKSSTKGGYGSGCQTITSGAVTEFAADGTPSRSLPVQLQGLSVDAALSPDEMWLAIASPGAFARSMATLQLYATSAAMPSSAGSSSCSSPSLSVSNENQVVAVAFDAAGVLYALSREPAELQIYELSALASPTGFLGGNRLNPTLMRRATIALDARSMRDTGHDLFHADVGQGLACASCHGEALDDGHVWSFRGIGPRRTQTMRGGFLATAPFHWDGDMSSMSHLVDDVMTGRMGGFAVELSFATALAQWLQQLPALTLPARDAAAVERGKQLFQGSETGCSSCHSGANLTNNESRDVGTGGSFQVPGLLGLALRPPYMHSGCAKTLLDRFQPECGGGDAHGKTSQLSEAQKLDLVAYLSSL
jgi:mono/diheme cytochrome c family protein